ncbi:MAG: hypothetical protein DMG17_12470, partial [Acidobacteria bacterium]
MDIRMRLRRVLNLLALSVLPVCLLAQSTTGTISGSIVDAQQAVIPRAMVTARNVETNISRSVLTNEVGRFRIPNLPVGPYEVSVELGGFARYVRSGIILTLNQEAVLDIMLQTAGVTQEITVQENATVLNVSNAEVGVHFDTRRISELPLGASPTGTGGFRNVFNIALSAPGVSQLASGQSEFSTGVNFSVNGTRFRSNNFMIDGQDTNEPGVSGRAQSINNPDIVQEIRLITNQFAAEYGRAAGSIMNIVTKSGSNDLHGTAFWFHNDNALNAPSNLDKKAFAKAPFRVENQIGGTVGGPIIKNRTFFFGSYQRSADRRLGSGFTLNGAPTEAGRQVLQSAVGNRPQVAALLKFLPAAQAPIGQSLSFMAGGTTYAVPLGSLTGSAGRRIDNHQFSTRVDHQLNDRHTLSGRYMFTDDKDAGQGQKTPPGLTTLVPTRQQAANVWLTSTLSNTMVNEVRTAYQRYATTTTAQNTASQEIPSIEISELGLTGFNAGDQRTAIGLASNLPQYRFNNIYQIQDNLSLIRGAHALKFGADFRRSEIKSFFVPATRGILAYSNLQRFVDDIADNAATINRPLPGGQTLQYYKWYDLFFFGQDEWKVSRSFTLNYGLRYEVPGNTFNDLVPVNNRIVQTAGGDERYRFGPVPKRDINNFQPRVGFNWNPRTGTGNPLGLLTGGDKFVLRGGYSRTYDYAFLNINLNIFSAFPFVASVPLPTITLPGGGRGAVNAFTSLPSIQPFGIDPLQLTRTIVGGDFRSPAADQFGLEIQRELARDLVFRVGYVGTKGTSLFETIDGNPRLPPSNQQRVDPTIGIRRLRANAASSIYHSLQLSAEKRLTRGFSAGFHYTWSAFIDDASEIFNPSSGEVAIAQDSFNRRADRGRSSYDRPNRFTGNFVYEIPALRNQPGVIGHILGGWQVNSFFTFQSGQPFTVLNGSDPTGALNGISGLVGLAIRPNLNTTLDTSRMSITELLNAGGRSLFSTLAPGVRAGNVGRNTLRADRLGQIDMGFIKNTRVAEGRNLQFRVEMYNATNSRNFGIPQGGVISSNFLNQWGTDGGNRRVFFALR